MNKELLNQFVDTVKNKYSEYRVYIDSDSSEWDGDDFLYMGNESQDHKFHMKSLQIPFKNDVTDLMKDVQNIYIMFYREHLLNIIL